MKTLITRTIPLDPFVALVTGLVALPEEREWIVLIQKKITLPKIEGQILKTVEIPEGPFRLGALDFKVRKMLETEKIQEMIITSNNSQFSGYNEYLKLAVKLNIPKIRMVTVDMKWKEWRPLHVRFRLYRMAMPKFIRLTVEFFKLLAVLMAVSVVFPIALCGYKLRCHFR